MNLKFFTTDVFTNTLHGGNPLAVVPDARALSDDMMGRIAKEFCLSETVFVFPPTDAKHTRRLRIFTPDAEMPFAGHPTLGAAYVLIERGYVPAFGDEMCVVFEEGIGPIKVRVRLKEGRPEFMQLESTRQPELGPTPPGADELAALLSLKLSDLEHGSLQPRSLSCGVPFLIIPLTSRDALRRARLNLELWERNFSASWAPHIYPIAWEDMGRSVIAARMFAPALGIAEDPATGAAATALAAYLGSFEGERVSGAFSWTIHQGQEIGRPSTLLIEAELLFGNVRALRVGGSAVLVSEGTLLGL